MDTILIVGLETLVGTHLAASYSERHQVIGVSTEEGRTAAHIETICLPEPATEEILETIADVAPNRIILCGSMSTSYWLNREAAIPSKSEIRIIREWAAAGHRADCQVTLISSDAVFSGPWMFHDEQSDCHCDSTEALTLRTLEREVLSCSPETLVVRTNTFGWSAEKSSSVLQNIIEDLQQQTGGPYCATCYASPILVNDFAEILESVHQSGLTGVCHIGGGERVNLQVFATKLAEQFDLPYPNRTKEQALSEKPAGFMTGEHSLRSQRIRQELRLPLPMISDGLARLHAQSLNGYREAITKGESKVPMRAA